MASGRKLAALVIVFAAGASGAATCADGSSPGSNGCCAATNECPPCVAKSVSSSGDDGPTCTCSGCAGETATIDSNCAYNNCPGTDTGTMIDNCEMCTGDSGTCMNSASACNTYLQMDGLSVDNNGLISATGSGGASGGGGASCDACCPAGCDGPADASKPECKACAACEQQGTPCPSDSAAASLGSGALGTTLLAATTTALLRGLLL